MKPRTGCPPLPTSCVIEWVPVCGSRTVVSTEIWLTIQKSLRREYLSCVLVRHRNIEGRVSPRCEGRPGEKILKLPDECRGRWFRNQPERVSKLNRRICDVSIEIDSPGKPDRIFRNETPACLIVVSGAVVTEASFCARHQKTSSVPGFLHVNRMP